MLKAMPIQIAHADAVARVSEILTAIVTSPEWGRYSDSFAAMSWMDGRSQFVRFFDVFEGQAGEEWLGIVEWAIIEEMRLRGDGLANDLTTAARCVVAKMAGHPDIELPH